MGMPLASLVPQREEGRSRRRHRRAGKLTSFDIQPATLSMMRSKYTSCMEGDRRPGNFANSLYAMHFSRWKEFVPRSQIMVFEFDSMLSRTREHVDAATDFFGLPRLEGDDVSLHLTNDQHSRNKLHTIECRTKAQLAAALSPWNEMLYTALAVDAADAPAAEPRFAPFTTSVACSDDPQEPPWSGSPVNNATGRQSLRPEEGARKQRPTGWVDDTAYDVASIVPAGEAHASLTVSLDDETYAAPGSNGVLLPSERIG